MADFTNIKRPTIYYHLEKMEREELVTASRETDGARPERTVYTVTSKGKDAFIQGLTDQLALTYQPTFDADALFYFAEHLDNAQIIQHLETFTHHLERSIAEIESHRKDITPYISKEQLDYVGIIFEHHALHYQAEREWAKSAMEVLAARGKNGAEAANH